MFCFGFVVGVNLGKVIVDSFVLLSVGLVGWFGCVSMFRFIGGFGELL